MKLYTLCGSDRQVRFSPHSWKIVMALAHKGLQFEEAPVPFTEIPKQAGGFSPTVPVLDDGGTLVRDSFEIALYLERNYPDSPSLFKGEGGEAVTRAVEGYSQFVVQPALMKIILCDIHAGLAEADQAYFRKSREERLKMPLEAYVVDREKQIAEFPAKLEPVRHALRHNPFLGGESPLFADYIVFGALQWARVVCPDRLLPDNDPVADWFERCLDLHQGVGRSVRAASERRAA